MRRTATYRAGTAVVLASSGTSWHSQRRRTIRPASPTDEQRPGDPYGSPGLRGGEAIMKSNAFVKQTEERLAARRDALRRSLAGEMGSLRAPREGAVGDEIDAAIATEQAELNS